MLTTPANRGLRRQEYVSEGDVFDRRAGEGLGRGPPKSCGRGLNVRPLSSADHAHVSSRLAKEAIQNAVGGSRILPCVAGKTGWKRDTPPVEIGGRSCAAQHVSHVGLGEVPHRVACMRGPVVDGLVNRKTRRGDSDVAIVAKRLKAANFGSLLMLAVTGRRASRL
jgi:hypothetical protein